MDREELLRSMETFAAWAKSPPKHPLYDRTCRAMFSFVLKKAYAVDDTEGRKEFDDCYRRREPNNPETGKPNRMHTT